MNKIVILFVFFSLISCTSSRKYDMYKKFKSEVSSEVFSNFPIKSKKKIESSFIQIINYPSAYSSLEYSGMFIFFKYDSVSFFKDYNYLKKNSSFESTFKDSCNIFIPLGENNKNKCNESYVPIPNIYDKSIDIESLQLDNNLNYYILDYGWGKYIKEENLYSLSNLSSTNLKNGFSTGAFADIKQNIIIYWLIIW